jgi:hypothetical protein
MIFRATIPVGREPGIRVADEPGTVLHAPHLPFHAVYAGVTGAVGNSAADHADNGQNREAEPELVHIEFLLTKRRVGWRAIGPTVCTLRR